MLLIIVFLTRAGEAGDGMVTVSVVNDGLTASRLLVRDENCARPEREVCETARRTLSEGACLGDPATEACLAAIQLAGGEICRSDLVYDGAVAVGERIHVRVCLSPGGYAGISIRTGEGYASWHRYHMLNDGDTVKFP